MKNEVFSIARAGRSVSKYVRVTEGEAEIQMMISAPCNEYDFAISGKNSS